MCLCLFLMPSNHKNASHKWNINTPPYHIQPNNTKHVMTTVARERPKQHRTF